MRLINQFYVLSIVSGDDLCLGQNTISLPFCQSNCIHVGKVMKKLLPKIIHALKNIYTMDQKIK